jgi:hypothetical protein
MTAAALVSDGGMTVTQDPPELTIVPHHTNLPEGCEETDGARRQTDSASHEGFPCSQELLWQPVSSSCGTLFLSQTFAWALARFSERSGFADEISPRSHPLSVNERVRLLRRQRLVHRQRKSDVTRPRTI